MAVYTSESESPEILIQPQEEKAIITQTSSSSSSTIEEEEEEQQQQQQQGRVGVEIDDDYNNGDDDDEVILWKPQPKIKKPKKRSPQVCLEGFVEPSDDDEIPRTKSLTDDDLDELKGCVDLGFGFSYDEIPELCNTLPALELCYSMSQKFLDDHPNQQHLSNGKTVSAGSSDTASSSESESSSPMPTWKISSPGDHPEDVKARLKFWAQAVACTVRLCS